MKLLIVGSRSIKNFDLTPFVPEPTNLIISGGAEGIDTLAEAYADTHCISKLILHPEYDRYGRAAPLKRNEQMVDLADSILVVWDGVSRGRKYTIEYAKAKNKPINLIKGTYD